jgi:hypothetical protein
MLLVIIDKFGTNLMLANVNKLKSYKYMESEVQKIRTTNVNILGAKWSWTLGGGI